MKLKKYVGSREFYRMMLAVMIPILVQNVITNFVNLLDNVMVGQVGTEPMSGVAIVNQLIFVFNICIFGSLSGPGIFCAQFFGCGDRKGVRDTFRIKLVIGVFITAVFTAVFLLRGDDLIRLFLHDGSSELSIDDTLSYGRDYLKVIMIQMLPFVLTQIYSGTLREAGETVLPMRASLAAVFTNLVLNYILIFGKLGLPAMGVVGAAIATDIARFAELFIMVFSVHRNKEKYPFIEGAYASLHVPGKLCGNVAVKGAPLLANELLWASGMTLLNQCYSMRGLDVVSATNIASTVSNLFSCALFAMGTTISIVVGQQLGAGETDRAVDTARKMIAFSVAICVVTGGIMCALSPFIPLAYNTTQTVRELACRMLIVQALLIPLHAFCNSCYFTLRSGGKTLSTFLFDSFFLWTVCVPVALVLSRLTDMEIMPMFIAVNGVAQIKCVIGYIMVKKRRWVNNLTK